MREYINHFNQTKYSKNYIHRLMKLIHIHARIRRKKSNYVKVKPEQVGENILNRNFKADYPNQNGVQMSQSSRFQDKNRNSIYQLL